MVLKVLSAAFGSSDMSTVKIKLEDYNVGMRKHSATAMQAICCTQPWFKSVPTRCQVTLQDKINTGSNLLLIGCQSCNNTANPPVVAAEVASDVLSLPSSASSSGFLESTSNCVLQSRLKTLDTTWGRACSVAAPVWSSERLFPAMQTKTRGRLIIALTPTFTHSRTTALPSSSHDYSGLGLFWGGDEMHSFLKTGCLFEGHEMFF